MSWTFLHPGRLWLLAILAAIVAAIAAGAWQRRRRAVRFTNLDLLAEIVPRRPAWHRHLVNAGLLAGFATGILGIAQPYRTERLAGERSIIIIDLDVSLSMMATDVTPSRLDAAKEQAKLFVEQVDPSIDIGLVSFSRTVRVRVAPTLDRDKVLHAIDRLQLEEGTAIGDAIIASADVIAGEFREEASGPRSTSPPGGQTTPLTPDGTPAAIVILTDGETVDGRTPGPVGAQEAAKYGIPVYGIAFGTPSGTVTLDDPRTGIPYDQPVPVKYEELTAAAELTGGKFYAAESEGDLGEVYSDIERQLSPALEVPEPERHELTVRYLAVALGLLALCAIGSQLLLGGLA